MHRTQVKKVDGHNEAFIFVSSAASKINKILKSEAFLFWKRTEEMYSPIRDSRANKLDILTYKIIYNK